MGIPQILIIVLYTLSLGMEIQQHGKPKEGNVNAGSSFLACAIIGGLLYWGGFFS